MDKDTRTLPREGVVIICCNDSIIKTFSEFYPDWHYINTIEKSIDLVTLAKDAVLIVIVGEKAVKKFPYRTNILLPWDIPCVVALDTSSYSVLREIREVYYAPRTFIKNNTITLVPDIGILVVGADEKEDTMQRLLTAQPYWTYTTDLTQVTATTVGTVLLDKELESLYQTSNLYNAGVPYTVVEDASITDVVYSVKHMLGV